MLLKLRNICINAEQSIPLNDFPPHLYLVFLNIVIFLKGFFSLNEIGLTLFLLIHPFENLKNLILLSMTLIFEPNEISVIFFSFVWRFINFCF